MSTPRNPETIAKAIALIEEMIELKLKAIELHREMRRYLLILSVAPGIETKCKVRTKIDGRMTYSRMFGDTPTKDTMFHVIPEIGDEVVVPLFDVPMDLWRDGMAKNLKRAQPGLHARLVAEQKKETADVA